MSDPLHAFDTEIQGEAETEPVDSNDVGDWGGRVRCFQTEWEKKTKRHNTEMEDLILVKGWGSVSLDVVVGMIKSEKILATHRGQVSLGSAR